jgi:hypothetical protein
MSISLYALADLWDILSDQARERERRNIERILRRRHDV